MCVKKTSVGCLLPHFLSQLQPEFNIIPRFWDQQRPEAKKNPKQTQQLHLCKLGLSKRCPTCWSFCSDTFCTN